jgi:hypothetical protein
LQAPAHIPAGAAPTAETTAATATTSTATTPASEAAAGKCGTDGECQGHHAGRINDFFHGQTSNIESRASLTRLCVCYHVNAWSSCIYWVSVDFMMAIMSAGN